MGLGVFSIRQIPQAEYPPPRDFLLPSIFLPENFPPMENSLSWELHPTCQIEEPRAKVRQIKIMIKSKEFWNILPKFQNIGKI